MHDSCLVSYALRSLVLSCGLAQSPSRASLQSINPHLFLSRPSHADIGGGCLFFRHRDPAPSGKTSVVPFPDAPTVAPMMHTNTLVLRPSLFEVPPLLPLNPQTHPENFIVPACVAGTRGGTPVDTRRSLIPAGCASHAIEGASAWSCLCPCEPPYSPFFSSLAATPSPAVVGAVGGIRAVPRRGACKRAWEEQFGRGVTGRKKDKANERQMGARYSAPTPVELLKQREVSDLAQSLSRHRSLIRLG